MDDYVFGHLPRAAQARQNAAGREEDAASRDEDAGPAEFIRGRLAAGAFPWLASVGAADLASAGDPAALDERFELGLGLLLDGIAARFG